MSQELVKCPCCDKMVPANDVELAYRFPDAIACMSEEDIESSCRYTNDYVVCDDEYYYLRCTLSLPVHDTGRDYCLGVWAQISPNSFDRVRELWDEEEQANEHAMKGLLANSVHLNTGVEDTEITVQLTGPTSRPTVTIQDQSCSLYQEQQCGITIHRASEYSDLCR